MIITHLPHRVVNRRKRPFLEYRPKSSSTVTPTYFDHFDENGKQKKKYRNGICRNIYRSRFVSARKFVNRQLL